jgi:predicted translin family RNA/ssDNA-binding protein
MDTLKENIQHFSRQAAQLSHDANVAFNKGDFTKGRQLMKQAVETGSKCQNLIQENFIEVNS